MKSLLERLRAWQQSGQKGIFPAFRNEGSELVELVDCLHHAYCAMLGPEQIYRRCIPSVNYYLTSKRQERRDTNIRKMGAGSFRTDNIAATSIQTHGLSCAPYADPLQTSMQHAHISEHMLISVSGANKSYDDTPDAARCRGKNIVNGYV